MLLFCCYFEWLHESLICTGGFVLVSFLFIRLFHFILQTHLAKLEPFYPFASLLVMLEPFYPFASLLVMV
jgi:hypothetical protein